MMPCRLAALTLLALTSAAHAHAILIESTPAPRATIAGGPEAVTMRFNSRIDRDRSRLTLLAPGRADIRLPIGASGPADQMTTQADLAPGDYVIRWQVLAVDGHITRGDLPFTVAP